MDKKFSMMGPDGLPVEFDDYGGLSKMFKDARFKKGSSRAAPAPNYSQSYQGAQRQPATGTSAPGYDYTYRDKAPGFEGGYRPYPKPWAPPPPQLPDQASDTARNAVRRGFFGSINPRQAIGRQLGEIIGSWSNPSQDQFINSLPFAGQRAQQQGTNILGGLFRGDAQQPSGGIAYLGGSRNFDESTGQYRTNPYSGPVIADGGDFVQQPPATAANQPIDWNTPMLPQIQHNVNGVEMSPDEYSKYLQNQASGGTMEKMPKIINPTPQPTSGMMYLGGSPYFDESTGTYKAGSPNNPYWSLFASKLLGK